MNVLDLVNDYMYNSILYNVLIWSFMFNNQTNCKQCTNNFLLSVWSYQQKSIVLSSISVFDIIVSRFADFTSHLANVFVQDSL